MWTIKLYSCKPARIPVHLHLTIFEQSNPYSHTHTHFCHRTFTAPYAISSAAAAATKPVAKLGKQFARLSRPNKQSPQSAQKSSTPTVVTRSASNDDDDDDISGASSPRVTPDVELPPGARTPTVSKAQSQRNVRALFDSERAAAKATLHMVVVGHVDAGKSTLMGHTLLDLGAVTQRTMHKHERDSQKMGKSSFMYAWVLDETGEERERGITMDVGSVRFETDTKSVSVRVEGLQGLTYNTLNPSRSRCSMRPATKTSSRT